MKIPFSRLFGRARAERLSSEAVRDTARALGISTSFFEDVAPFAAKDGRDSYGGNPFAHRAIETLAGALSSIDLKFFEAADEEREKVLKPIRNRGAGVPNLPYIFKRKPNHYSGGQRLLADFFRAYYTAGVAAMHFVKRPSATNEVMEIHTFTPSQLQVNVSEKTGEPESYTIGYGSSKKNYEVGDNGECELFVMTRHNPEKPFKGLSPAQVGHTPLAAVNESNKHNYHLTKSGMACSGLLVPEARADGSTSPMSQENAEKFQKMLQEYGAGAKSRGKLLFMDFALKHIPLSQSQKDMAFKDITDFLSRQILLTYGVPPQLLGVSTEANAYANYQNASQSFFENVVIPMIEDFCDDLSAYFERNGLDFCVEADKESISVYRDIRVERMKNMDEVSFMGIDEKRDFFGLPPADDKLKEELSKAKESKTEKPPKKEPPKKDDK